MDMVRGILEDARKGLLLNDFAGGVITDIGALSLGPNQSPDALNVFAWEGNLRFRGGYSTWSTLPTGADAGFTYYDALRVKHMVVWSGGSVYEVTSGAPVLIAAGVYTQGEQVAHAQLNGIMYWATLTVPLRQWDGTTEQAVANSGGTGVIAPPACSFLIAFNGALVAVNVVTVPGGASPGNFMWSNVNDPTKWVGANTQAVGSNDGQQCVFALLMGIAQVGVTPTKQFMVAKERQIFLYTGALGALTEQAVSCPIGILDGNSAAYVPTKQGLGAVLFLGGDAQFYMCNGVEAIVVSEGIKTLTYNVVDTALTLNPQQRFNAIYNQRQQYYICDFGSGYQLAYKWDTGAWWPFAGWPSGPYLAAPVANGLPGVFVAAALPAQRGVYQLGLDFTNDNGTAISAYYTTAYLHLGKPERQKLYQAFTLFAYNVGIQYSVVARGMPRSDNLIETTKTVLLNDPAYTVAVAAGGLGIWDVSTWDNAAWVNSSTSIQPYPVAAMQSPLVVPSLVTKWASAGMPLPLKSGAVQFTIAWNNGVPDFRMVSLKIAALMQSEAFVGQLKYTAEGQVTTGTNIFTNTGNGS